jgi:hypothetical protein
MDVQLTTTEINSVREILHDYEPAQHALQNLQQHNGNVKRSFQDLWAEKNSPLPIKQELELEQERESLWEVTLRVLREELCGDEGFRGQLSEYTKNPGSSPLLTGLIISLVSVAGAQGLPLDPAIATVVVLYILKIGLNIFCEYTEPIV